MSERTAEEEIREEHRVIDELLGRTFRAPLVALEKEVGKVKEDLCREIKSIKTSVRDLVEPVTVIGGQLSGVQAQCSQLATAVADIGNVKQRVEALYTMAEEQKARMDEILERVAAADAAMQTEGENLISAIADIGKVEQCIETVRGLAHVQDTRMDGALEKALIRVAHLEAVLCGRLWRYALALGVLSVVEFGVLMGVFWIWMGRQ